MRIHTIAITTLLLIFAGTLTLGQNGNDLFQQALARERAEADFEGAIQLYLRVLRDPLSQRDRQLVARTKIQLGGLYERQGQGKGREYYQQVIDDYENQPDMSDVVREARLRLVARSVVASSDAALRDRKLLIARMDPVNETVLGSRAERLTEDSTDAWEEEPRWSSSGKHIAFSRRPNPSSFTPGQPPFLQRRTVIVRSWGTGAEELADVFGPPSGTSFAEFVWLHGSDTLLALAGSGAAQIKPLSSTRELTNGVRILSPSPSDRGGSRPPMGFQVLPDDLTISYLASANEVHAWDITTWTEKTEGQLGLPFLASDPNNPPNCLQRLNPEGTTLACVRNNRLVRYDVASTSGRAENYQELVAGIGRLGTLVWTRRGSILFARSDGGSTWQILRIPAQGGAPMFTGLEVTDLESFDLSPDGSHLVFAGRGYKILPPSPFVAPAPLVSESQPNSMLFQSGLIGTWKLDPSLSTAGIQPAPLTIRTYSRLPQVERIRALEIGLSAVGVPTMTVSSSTLDGMDSPIYSEKDFWEALSGMQTANTISVASIDANTIAMTMKANGQVTSTRTLTVGGNTLTETRDKLDVQGQRIGSETLVFRRGAGGPVLLETAVLPPVPEEDNPLVGAWKLNPEKSTPRPERGSLDLRKYVNIRGEALGSLLVNINPRGVLNVSLGVFRAGLEEPSPELPFTRVYNAFAIFVWVESGRLPAGVIVRRSFDAYTSELTRLSGTATGLLVYERSTVSKDLKTLTAEQRSLDSNGGETSGVLVYDRISR